MKSFYLATAGVLIFTFDFCMPDKSKSSYCDQDSTLRTSRALSHLVLTPTCEAGVIFLVSQMEEPRLGEHFCTYIAVRHWLYHAGFEPASFMMVSGFVLRHTQETRVNSLTFFFETRAENPSSQCCGRHDDQSALLSSLGSLLSSCL